MRDATKGAAEAAVGFEDAGAAVNVRWGAAFCRDAREWDIFTLERVLSISIVGRVFRGVGEGISRCELSCWLRSQECLRVLAEQIFELGA